MLRSRIIPTLLIRGDALVKTKNFVSECYIGDPINTVRIFNEKKVDELFLADIDATILGKEPNYLLLESLAYECRMPVCYVGGINSVNQARKIISLGIEKIGICTAAINDESLINRLASAIGSQSTVVVMDVRKKTDGTHKIYSMGGRHESTLDPVSFAMYAEDQGAGEIVLNSIDREGLMGGYDYQIIDKIHSAIRIPLTICGGAGKKSDLEAAIDRYGVVGIAAGSMFVFSGKNRAVLIQYPSELKK